MEKSCRKEFDWVKAAVIVLFLNLRGRIRCDWVRSNPWHRWVADYPSLVKGRVRIMRFDRFKDGETTDDFW